MKYDPESHLRRSIRLQGYDYAQAGAYFVTICAHNRECLFGEIVNDAVQLNTCGQIVAQCWQWLSEHYPYVILDEWVVMPNHLHGILVIADETDGRGASRRAPQPDATIPVKRKPLGQLIAAFKATSTKRILALPGIAIEFVWQRNYYEHIIRDERELNQIRQYIADNPLKWATDDNNPNIKG